MAQIPDLSKAINAMNSAVNASYKLPPLTIPKDPAIKTQKLMAEQLAEVTALKKQLADQQTAMDHRAKIEFRINVLVNVIVGLLSAVVGALIGIWLH